MEHKLGHEWSMHAFFKSASNPSDDYLDNTHLLGTFHTVEGFWALYSHLKRPKDLDPPTDYQLFRKGIRGIWEDDENIHGGKWMIRIKKEYSSYYWERLTLALIGEQFPVDVVGAVISVRFQEDIISLWNKTGAVADVRQEIRCQICTSLQLPSDCKLEYKQHNDSRKDGSSFRNTVMYQAGANSQPVEVPPKKGKKG
jgi:translation initiation factor 4E